MLARRIEPAERPLDPELERELANPPGWMYPWQMRPGVTAPILHPWLPRIHATRMAMMEDAVRVALGEPDSNRRVLDLACNEGWFGQQTLQLGAAKVLGLDIRDVNVRRAKLIAADLGISEDSFEIRQADVFEQDPADLGKFDVVLLLGLIYHVENPAGVVRLAKACTRRLCVIESQLTRHNEPIEWGLGAPETRFQPASFAVYPEEDSSVNPLASTEGVLSLVPNRAAVEVMGRAAGFSRVEWVEPTEHSHEVFIRGDRGLFLCWV